MCIRHCAKNRGPGQLFLAIDNYNRAFIGHSLLNKYGNWLCHSLSDSFTQHAVE